MLVLELGSIDAVAELAICSHKTATLDHKLALRKVLLTSFIGFFRHPANFSHIDNLADLKFPVLNNMQILAVIALFAYNATSLILFLL